MGSRKFKTLYAIVILILVGLSNAFSSTVVKIGEEKKVSDGTSHPYEKASGILYEKEYYNEGSAYIRIHFKNFSLAQGDFVEVENAYTGQITRYTGKGKKVRNGTSVISDFWSSVIKDDKAIVRLISSNAENDYGFDVDVVAYGYTQVQTDSIMRLKSICGEDNKEWAQCYSGTEMYEKAKAVCRLFMNGNSAGTGWLIGSEGHIMTNHHVIPDQETADNTEYEFMGEGSCGTDCSSWLGCRGTVEAYSGTLVKTNSDYDYSLVKLPDNLSVKYGYLQLRSTLPSTGERIYIPQHPGAKGKQISVYDDQSGGYSQVNGINSTDVLYYADTEGGSSGSPVIAYADNLVVALHHYGGCTNAGVRIPYIISDLGSLMPENGVSGEVTGPVILYQDCNYGGYAVSLNEGSYTLSQLEALGVLNDDISSLIVESGYRVVLYYDNNFAGSTVSLTGSEDCLVNLDFNDVTSSIVVSNESANWEIAIEAEDYSSMSGIETETCSDGGLNVGYVDDGDWLAYSDITFPYTGNYTFEYKVASADGGGIISLDLNAGSIVLGTVEVPETGDWQGWTTIQQTVHIDADTYAVGIYAASGGWNLDKFAIKYAESARQENEESAIAKDINSVLVYPNPVSDILYVDGIGDNTILKIYNSLGQPVLSTRKKTIDVSGLNNGVYIVQIVCNGQSVNKLFIKQ